MIVGSGSVVASASGSSAGSSSAGSSDIEHLTGYTIVDGGFGVDCSSSSLSRHKRLGVAVKEVEWKCRVVSEWTLQLNCWRYHGVHMTSIRAIIEAFDKQSTWTMVVVSHVGVVVVVVVGGGDGK